MSYTTRCPACGTTFRVVPDQLKISDGWVRCGHCADVFDATLHLQEWGPPAAAALPPSEPVPPAEPSPPVSVALPAPVPASVAALDAEPPAANEGPSSADTFAEPHQIDPDTSLNGAVAEPASPAPVDAPLVEAEHDADAAWPVGSGVTPEAAQDAVSIEVGATDEALDKVSEDPRHEPPVSSATAEDGASDLHADRTRCAEVAGWTVPDATVQPPVLEPATVAPGGTEPEQAVSACDAGEPGFVRQARRQAFWRSPAVRAVLTVLVLLLGGLQAIQWALHERDQLAAAHPELLPLLTQLCAPLGCEIGPVRRIDAVVIDSTTLVRRLGNFYAFDVVIKNTAAIPVAVPALELSLTDTRDSVVARRVFLPNELPGAPTLLPAQGSLPLSLRLSITDARTVPMAGYRALVFYP